MLWETSSLMFRMDPGLSGIYGQGHLNQSRGDNTSGYVWPDLE